MSDNGEDDRKDWDNLRCTNKKCNKRIDVDLEAGTIDAAHVRVSGVDHILCPSCYQDLLDLEQRGLMIGFRGDID